MEAPSVDWDSDQRPNLLEYSQGTDPTGVTTGATFAFTRESGSSFAMEYDQRTNAPDVELRVLSCTGLPASVWVDAVGAAPVRTGTSAHGHDRLRVTLPADGIKGFYRLGVRHAP